MRASLQHPLHDHKLCSASCIFSCILPLPSGAYLACLACLSKSSALSKMGRLWALTFTPVIVMNFEFCQRGATVDTPFLTVLKTWTSPLEHSVIILVCVRLEFPEFSAARALPQDLRTRPFVFGFAPNTCLLPWKGRECLVRHPHTSPAVARGHRPDFVIIGNVFLPVGSLLCQNDTFGQPITVQLLLEIFYYSWLALASPPYTCMEGCPSWLLNL